MRILEKLVKKIPNRVIRLLKKPLMIGTHHLMFSISPVRTRLQPRKFQLSISMERVNRNTQPMVNRNT